MTRIRRRRVIAARDSEPSAYERDLWRLMRLNTRERLDPKTPLTPADKVRLRLEAVELGRESQALWRERTGR